MMLFGFFLRPLSKHGFIMTAARLMFTAKVEDNDLLSDKTIKQNDEWKNRMIPNEELSEKDYN